MNDDKQELWLFDMMGTMQRTSSQMQQEEEERPALVLRQRMAQVARRVWTREVIHQRTSTFGGSVDYGSIATLQRVVREMVAEFGIVQAEWVGILDLIDRTIEALAAEVEVHPQVYDLVQEQTLTLPEEDGRRWRREVMDDEFWRCVTPRTYLREVEILEGATVFVIDSN